MRKDFFLPRSRAAVAVLTMIILGACSDVREPTAPGKALPKIHTKAPSADYSFQDGSQITVYDDVGGWTQLDVSARTLTYGNGAVVPLTQQQTIDFLNDYQGTVVFDRVAQAVQGFAACSEVCIEPTGVGTTPLGMSSTSGSGRLKIEIVDSVRIKPKATDRFGIEIVDLDKTLKELKRISKKSGDAVTFEWPPNCSTSLSQVRAAKDDYLANRHSTVSSIGEIFHGVATWNIPVLVERVVLRSAQLLDKFFFKSLSQANMSLTAALYTGVCGGAIPNSTGGYGWFPGAVLECFSYRDRVSYDGGINWVWGTVRNCWYRSAQ